MPAVLSVVLGTACATTAPSVPKTPQIPTILPPTTVVRTPAMVDRAPPDECELIVPVEVLNQKLGREIGGETRGIVGVPEPTLGRTAKMDCYYGVGERQPLAAAPVVVGLATYADDATAKDRVTDSVDAERREGATVGETDVGKLKAAVVTTSTERLLLGSLGKTTFVVRIKTGFLPDDQSTPFLAAVAQQAMTPVEDA